MCLINTNREMSVISQNVRFMGEILIKESFHCPSELEIGLERKGVSVLERTACLPRFLTSRKVGGTMMRDTNLPLPSSQHPGDPHPFSWQLRGPKEAQAPKQSCLPFLHLLPGPGSHVEDQG